MPRRAQLFAGKGDGSPTRVIALEGCAVSDPDSGNEIEIRSVTEKVPLPAILTATLRPGRRDVSG